MYLTPPSPNWPADAGTSTYTPAPAPTPTPTPASIPASTGLTALPAAPAPAPASQYGNMSSLGWSNLTPDQIANIGKQRAKNEALSYASTK